MFPRYFKRGTHQNASRQTPQIPYNVSQERWIPQRLRRPYTMRMEIQGPPEQARGVKVTYTNDPIETDAWLRNNVMDIDCRAIGFDIEWRPQFVKKKLGGKENKTAVLQLSTDTDTLVCHIIHVKPLPRFLAGVLANENIRKVGCGIRPDVIKLLKDTGLQCKGALDLAELAKQSGYTKQHGQGLKTLANNLLGMELNKPKRVQLSNWEKLPLQQGQIQYAALDAWVGVKLYSHIQKIMHNQTNVKSEIDGLINIEPSDIVVVQCNVCGKKCKGKRKLQEHLANAGHSKCPRCGMMFVFSVTRKHRNKCIGPADNSSQTQSSKIAQQIF